MVITYYGEGSFRVQNGDYSILVDPTSNHLKAQVVLRTLSSANIAAPSAGEICFPGEYEINNIEITGVGVPSESSDTFVKTAYSVLWDEVNLVFLGHISKALDPDIIDELGEPDVLFIPSGGGHFLAPEAAAKLAKQLEPKLVIPSFYKTSAEFLKAYGRKAEPEDKLVFKKKDLADEKGRVVVLKASR